MYLFIFILFILLGACSGSEEAFDANHPPVIEVFSCAPSYVEVSDPVHLYCRARDPDGDIVRYRFRASNSIIEYLGAGEGVAYFTKEGKWPVICEARDYTDSIDESVCIVDVER